MTEKSGLSASKQALLAQWLKGKQESGAIPRRSGPAPLSVMQQRLWFMEQLMPGTAAYNITEVIRLGGRLEVGALERALTEIVARHDALRYAFVAGCPGAPAGPGAAAPGALGPGAPAAGGPGEPVQHAGPPRPVILRVEPADPDQLQALTDAEARRPLNLATGPLCRFRLLRLGPDEHALLVTFHHIIADGWSMAVFLTELIALYEAFAAGRPAPLPPLPIQYGDFAAWQRDRLQGDLIRRELAWWKERLGGPVPVLELPTDFPRPPVQSFRGAQHHFRFPPALTEAVRRLCQGEGLTLFMALYAAWVALLHRYSGQTDILCGTPVANRSRPEVEGLIGFFVNTLVLRTDLSGDPSFRALARRVREFALGAFAHQELPFEKLVEELAPQRSMSHQPLFQVVFNLIVTLREDLGTNLSVDVGVGSTGTSQFDLMLAVSEGAGGMEAYIEYTTDLYRPETVARMAGHYLTLLAAAAADPDQPVGALPLLTPAEAAELAGFGGECCPAEGHVGARFAAVAAARPDATALLWDGGSMTYGELDRRSNQLARHLRRLGAGPGTLVGIAADRSPELIIGLLAILKAGGAYVPFDPTYPIDRLAYMLQDTGVPILLVKGHMLPPARARVVPLVEAIYAAESPEPPNDTAVTADSLAYIIYTSGSTGRPKGSLVPHRGIIRLVTAPNYAVMDEHQLFLQLAPVSFDASTLEVWGPLLNGGRLALMPPGTPSLAELAAAIRRFGVTIIWLTAGLFHLMVEQQLDALLTVPQILAGGDVLSVPHVRRVLERLAPGGRLINGYGPTENTTFTCCHPMERGTVLSGSVPIGRPISGSVVRVLDRSLQPVPVGVPGELCAGGDGLAMGYLNQPELTAERFVTAGGERLYRTGDLVRWLPDGTIEFLGRLDDQVKIRGFRVEPGEIAYQLGQAPGVADCSVIVREDKPGDKRLVAYYTGAAAVADLRAWLKERLPEYMLPAAFVAMEALPLNPNGKVDRKALPAPEALSAAGAFVAPRTPAEAKMAAIWADVLGLPRISADANFFESGGHSLLAIRLLSRVREAFGVELPLRALFERPTVADLATAVGGAAPSATGDLLPALTPDPAGAHLPFALTPVQQAYLAGRSGYFDLGACGTNFFSEFAVTGGGPAFLERFQSALQRLIDRHDSLRTVLLEDGRQQILPTPVYHLPVIDLRDAADAEAALEAVRQRMKYDKAGLYTWPLFEFAAYLLADGQIRILSRVEALILDGTSNSILLKELFALLEDPSVMLPAISCSFRDYALGLEALQETELYARSRRYWQERVKSLPPAPAFPLAIRPSPLVQSRPVGRADILLGPEQWAGLKARAGKAGLTPSAVILTALADVIARWAAAPRFTISLVASFRLPFHRDIETMVGNFNSITLLGVDGAGGSFVDRARRLARQITADLEHLYFPGFAALQEWNRLTCAGARCASPVLANSLVEYSHSAYQSRQLDRNAAATPDGAITLTGSYFTIPQITFEPIFGVEPDGSLAAWWVSADALYPPGMVDAMFAAYKELVRRLAEEEEAWAADVVAGGPAPGGTVPGGPVPGCPPVERPLPDPDLELRVADLWAAVLGAGPVGAEENLFALGATSLTAIRLIVATEARFGCRLPLTILADDPTVRGFARAIQTG